MNQRGVKTEKVESPLSAPLNEPDAKRCHPLRDPSAGPHFLRNLLSGLPWYPLPEHGMQEQRCITARRMVERKSSCHKDRSSCALLGDAQEGPAIKLSASQIICGRCVFICDAQQGPTRKFAVAAPLPLVSSRGLPENLRWLRLYS